MVRGASRRSGSSFGSSKTQKTRNQLLRDLYSTDRYPTPEDYIRAVEENPELFDPEGDNSKFRYHDSGNGRGVSGHNLGGRNKSKWLADNPVEVDVDTDPGSISVSSAIYSDDQGNTVSVVAGLDLVPMGISMNVNGDVGTIAVDLGMPGDAIGVTVGASIDIDTGDIIGGQVGLAGGGLAVDVNQIRKDGETCATLTVTYFGVGASYQQCRKDDEPPPEPPPPEPTPPPEPPPELTPEETENNDFEWPKIPQPPGSGLFPGGPEDNVLFILGVIEGGGKQFIEKYRDLKYSKTWLYAGRLGPGTSGYMHQKWQMGEVNDSTTLIIDEPGNSKYSKFPYLDPPGQFLGGTANIGNMTIKWAGKRKDFDLYYTGPIIESSKGENGIFYAWSSLTCLYAEINDQPVPPPEPPIPEEEEVTCCDLEPVMSLLRKVSKAVGEVGTAVGEVGTAVGTDQFPANMPKSFLQNEGIKTINNLAELQVYHLEIMDQLIGKFPIEMEIIDTDPLTPGNQAKKVKLINLAEAIAELFGLAISGANDSAIQTSASFRALVELVSTRQTVIQNYRSIEAIMEWLGFAVSEEKEMMKSLITIPKGEEEVFEEITRYLQESEIEVKVNQLADKNNLRVELKELLHAAAIIKTLFFKKVDPNGSMKDQLKPWLDSFNPNNADTEKDWKDRIEFLLEQLAKDESGNIDKDKVAKIMNTYQLQKDE